MAKVKQIRLTKNLRNALKALELSVKCYIETIETLRVHNTPILGSNDWIEIQKMADDIDDMIEFNKLI